MKMRKKIEEERNKEIEVSLKELKTELAIVVAEETTSEGSQKKL